MKIYVITCLKEKKYSSNRTYVADKRVYGYYLTFEEAESDVLANSLDIWECGGFTYCVIEAIKPGIFSAINDKEELEEYWYFCTMDKKDPYKIASIQSCKRPKCADYYGAISMG